LFAGGNTVTESILSSFLRLRQTAPQREIFTYVDDKGDDQETLTVEQLALGAERVAAALRS
jgi:acyl-CoA synthetase (AMP-forming)/AMP-acid ligase II